MDDLGFDVDFQASGLPARRMNLREVGRLLGLNALAVRALFIDIGWLGHQPSAMPTARAAADGVLAPPAGASSRMRFLRDPVIRELQARGHDLALPPLEYLRLATDRLMVHFRKAWTGSPPTPPFTPFSPALKDLHDLMEPVPVAHRGKFLLALEKSTIAAGARPDYFQCLADVAGLRPLLRAQQLGRDLPPAAPGSARPPRL